LHTERSILNFQDLLVTKTTRRLLPRYEFRMDEDYDEIVSRCVWTHGDGWLTPPLLDSLAGLRSLADAAGGWFPVPHVAGDTLEVRPVSAGVYRNGVLTAGEFGTLVRRHSPGASNGGIYTSYSGYTDANSAGTVQMTLLAKHLETAGSPFWDLGMPLPYKTTMGARTVQSAEFVHLWREGLT
jgi:Leu/Phe-tRNA-protein transferase